MESWLAAQENSEIKWQGAIIKQLMLFKSEQDILKIKKICYYYLPL